MSEARRHSVDVPLSRTLFALRRVRSLRDPSTNSMSKFTAFIDNLGWETRSFNEASLGLENVHDGVRSDKHSLLGLKNFLSDRILEEYDTDAELDYDISRRPNVKLISQKKSGRIQFQSRDLLKMKRDDESGFSKSSMDGVHESSGLFSESSQLDLTWFPHCTSHLSGDMNSVNDPKIESARSGERAAAVLKRKSVYGKLIKPSGVVEGVSRSHVGSSCPSITDTPVDGSSVSTNEEVDVVASNHHGCGVSCCWPRTPKFRELNLPSDMDGYAFLSKEGKETPQSGKERSSVHFNRDLAMHADTPRSLSQKFRPRSFSELVGQHVVAQSLLSAIAKRKVASLYLFHGSRGTGKTSTSRIFAAALNCFSLEENRPCGLCRECILFFSGRGQNVKEVDAAKMNRSGRVKALLKNAALAPVSSRFKVFIIDECQLLRGETWAAFLTGLEELPRHAVFVMVTADLDKLPRGAVSRCQRYHFPKIRDADIVSRLQKICDEEGLNFDKIALDFVAAKSNGSLRDAETILDQLSLLGKRITLSLAYELTGVVSDDELLDLLDLALSSDTSNTVRKARELMRSRVDPMQLISQLANLIMDILAGRCQPGSSEVGRRFFGRHPSEVDLQKLRHALKILSETEKQLGTLKNQTTWLTVALLQFSAGESASLFGRNDSRVCLETACPKDDGFCSTSSKREGLNNSISHACNPSESHQSEIHYNHARKLETIWRRTLEECQSNTLKRFLKEKAKLSSVFVNQGLAIADVELCHPDHVYRAEKSWKLIASSLQLVLGCNVKIRINFRPCTERKNVKVKSSSFNLLTCSCGKQENSVSGTVDGCNYSDASPSPSNQPLKRETSDNGHSSYQFSPLMHRLPATNNAISLHRNDADTIRNIEVNALSTGTTTSHREVDSGMPSGCKLEINSSEEMKNTECQYLSTHEPEAQPSCFSKTRKLKRLLRSSDASCTICLRIQPNHKLEFSIPRKASIEPYFCMDDPYILCSSSNTQIMRSNTSADEDRPSKESKVSAKLHCRRSPRFPVRKGWLRKRLNERKCQWVAWILPCSTAKLDGRHQL
ncbi:protein STICHEL-like 2 isoform X2 [Magnolia sinica]|uniref:protein STICHEL-like 2 isoform X2 n=1 Tax=Magnolia sinica TaxID=86752 RepID=UPI0026589B9D|nr:protein STICHEL-like 2 isoform X2 [Magnolia sinica]